MTLSQTPSPAQLSQSEIEWALALIADGQQPAPSDQSYGVLPGKSYYGADINDPTVSNEDANARAFVNGTVHRCLRCRVWYHAPGSYAPSGQVCVCGGKIDPNSKMNILCGSQWRHSSCQWQP